LTCQIIVPETSESGECQRKPPDPQWAIGSAKEHKDFCVVPETNNPNTPPKRNCFRAKAYPFLSLRRKRRNESGAQPPTQRLLAFFATAPIPSQKHEDLPGTQSKQMSPGRFSREISPSFLTKDWKSQASNSAFGVYP